MRRRRAFPVPIVIALAGAITLWIAAGSSPRAAGGAQVSQDVRARAQRDGHARVIVELTRAVANRSGLGRGFAAVAAQQQSIRDAGDEVIAALPRASFNVTRRYQTVPYIALDATPAALAALDGLSDISRVVEDAIVRPVLADSVPLIQGDQAWQVGYDGTGTAVAVLDTGVDSTHPFLMNKVIEEACFSSTEAGVSSSFCPNGQSQQFGAGAAAPCPLADCIHGTHVAGIATGNGIPAGQTFSGVARGAQLIAVQVFSNVSDPASCGGIAPCAGAYTSDIISGLEYVYSLATVHNIASVNMSLGGSLFTPPCDSEPYKPAIDNLRAVGIATAIASGNSASTTQITSPACISTAISVGSTDKSDNVSWFSDVAPGLSLYAPGESITSSIPGGGYEALSGTSMATPHVAGTWAIIHQAVPSADVTTVLTALQQTGLPIVDNRFFGGSTAVVPRVRVFQALASMIPVPNPAPSAAGLSPSSAKAGSPTTAMTVTGSGFDAFSVVRWNGAARPTTVVSVSKVIASIPSTDLSTQGTAQVTVASPSPGGGESAPLTFTIQPGPSLTVSSSAVPPGAQETVTLVNGFGNSTDWLALATTGTPDSSYLQWTYVGTGVSNRTWTVTMPSSAGTYEFRLFVNNTRVATSPPVVVDPSINPAPVLTSIVPGGAPLGGAPFTLVATGSGFVAGSTVQWNGSNRPTTFVSSTTLQAAIGSVDLAVAATVPVTVVTPVPGGGTSNALQFTVGLTPTLTVSSTNVASGAPVTLTLTNGFGGPNDWLALAATGAPDSTYLQWTYVGAGVTTRTWTVTMPTAGGTYEFRLYLNNGFTRAATSPTVTVAQGPNPVPVATSLTPSGAAVGGSAFTLTVNGSGFVNGSTVQWNGAARSTTFVSSTQVKAAIGASDLTVSGTAQISVFSPAPGGGTSGTLPFTIGTPTLTVSSTNVAAGAQVTMTLTNGFGGATDWLALAATGAADTSYLQWTYVGAGVTTRTWTVTMPSSAGTYEFRLYPNNSTVRAATSPTVTVGGGPNPVPAVTSLSPPGAPLGGSAFTLTVNGTGFASSSTVQWNGVSRTTTFVSSTQLKAAIAASDLTVSGSVQVTVFSPAPGGGTSNAVPFVVGMTPVLSVTPTSVAHGGTVTLTLTNGFGGATDWVALAATGAPDTSYVWWTYIGAGVTSKTWTVTMPATAGTYEFRLYPNNGYTRAATSPTITVTP